MTALKESARDPARARYDLVLPAGEGWTQEIAAGETFRIVDLEGNQAADTLFYNAHDLDGAIAPSRPSARKGTST